MKKELKFLISEIVQQLLEKGDEKKKKVGRPRSKKVDPLLSRQIDRLGGPEEVATMFDDPVTPGQIRKIMRGDSGTSVKHAVELEKITAGIIEPEDLVGDE